MPLSKINNNSYQFTEYITLKEINEITENLNINHLQTPDCQDLNSWQLLNENLFIKRPDIKLRIWGYHNIECDLSFLTKMNYLRKFSADCLLTAKNIESITSLKKLNSLSIGIFDMESFEFLNNIDNENLEFFSISATKSKKPSLKFLKHLVNIKTLYIEGQNKEIESLANLTKLEDLTLRSISISNLEFIRVLNNLWSLDIKLGGTSNLNALKDLENIKYLELWQINKLQNIDVISSLTGLQNLFLQSLPNIKVFPSITNSKKLKRIYIENLKGLSDFTAIEYAPALEEFSLTLGNYQQPEDLIPVLRNKNLKSASGYFGSDKKNIHFKDLLIEYKINEYKYSDFKYC